MSDFPSPMNSLQATEPQPLAVRATEAARMLGISERTLWSLANRGEVPTVKIGGVRLYPVDELRAWLSRLAKSSKRSRGGGL